MLEPVTIARTNLFIAVGILAISRLLQSCDVSLKIGDVGAQIWALRGGRGGGGGGGDGAGHEDRNTGALEHGNQQPDRNAKRPGTQTRLRGWCGDVEGGRRGD